MNSRMLELATDLRTAELRAPARWAATSSTARSSTGRHAAEAPASETRHPVRRRTGWALVSVGLWLASADR
jgi:hypothetical protein